MRLLSWLTRKIRIWPGKKVEELITECKANFDADVKAVWGNYITASDKKKIYEKYSFRYNKIKSIKIPQWHYLYPEAYSFLSKFQHLNDMINCNNRAYLQNEFEKCNALLSNIDGKSLDEQQRMAVVINTHRCLVLAGAGSGKTLTISGKVKYLCEEKHVNSNDILLISFTHKSAEEMTERISGRLGIPIQATTFHKLGLDIIKDATGKAPDVIDSLFDFVKTYFENIVINDPEIIQDLVKYFAYYLQIPSDLNEYNSIGEVYEHEKGADFETIQSKYTKAQYIQENISATKPNKQTLQNEVVKSLEEVMIANFLFLHGIKYEYEKLYPYESKDRFHKPYRPDFYLPEYDIYLEHFGVNKNGRLPWLSKIEEEKYQEGMAWKRALHKKYETKLLETYSYFASEGRLLEELEQMLRKNGVHFRYPNYLEIFNAVYAKESDKYFFRVYEALLHFHNTLQIQRL